MLAIIDLTLACRGDLAWNWLWDIGPGLIGAGPVNFPGTMVLQTVAGCSVAGG